MTVTISSETIPNSWSPSATQAFVELKERKVRTRKAKEFLKKKKMALEVFKKMVRVSFKKARGSLKKNKMKEKEAEKVFWLAIEEQDPMFYSAAMVMERKEYKAWERRTCSTQQPWPLS